MAPEKGRAAQPPSHSDPGWELPAQLCSSPCPWLLPARPHVPCRFPGQSQSLSPARGHTLPSRPTNIPEAQAAPSFVPCPRPIDESGTTNRAASLLPWRRSTGDIVLSARWLSLYRARTHRPALNPAACRLKPRPGASPRCYSLPRLLPPASARLPGPRDAALVPLLATDPDLQGGSPPTGSTGEKRMPQSLPPSRGPAGLCESVEQKPKLCTTAVPCPGNAAAHLVFGVWLCFVSVRGLHLHLAVHRADGGGLGTRQGQHQPWHSSPPAAPRPLIQPLAKHVKHPRTGA